MYAFTLQMPEVPKDGSLPRGHHVDFTQVRAALEIKRETSNLHT